LSSRRYTVWFTLALLTVLTACGFQPLYGNRAPGNLAPVQAEEGLARISVGIIADRTGQMLRNELEVRLDPNNQGLTPLYNLTVMLNETITQLSGRSDASYTRANLTLSATYQLKLPKSDVPIYSGTVRTVNSYDILNAKDEFSKLTARNEARRRAARDLSDQIALRLALALVHQSSTEPAVR
jgi:LPS-assembly lipoprotein